MEDIFIHSRILEHIAYGGGSGRDAHKYLDEHLNWKDLGDFGPNTEQWV